MPEAILHVSSSAPVAYVVVRLTDVELDGTSAQATTGILNLRYQSTGSTRTTETDFLLDIQLVVKLNENVFFQKSWLESIKRNLV